MRRVMWRTAKADIFSRPVQSVLMFVVVFIAATGITAGLGQRQSATAQWDTAVAQANGPDIAIYGDDPHVLAEISRDPAVRQAAAPMAVAGTTSILLGNEPVDLPLRASAAPPSVGRPLIKAGRWLDGTASGNEEIVLERSFALAKGLRVGDDVTVRGTGGAEQLRVVGQTVDTIDCFFPQCGSQFGYVTPATLDRVAPTAGAPRTQVLFLNLRNRGDVGPFASAAFARYGTAIRGVNDWQDTRKDALSTNLFFAAFLSAFAIVLLLAAALVIASSVMARVLARYREIGILKAVGLTPGAVTGLILGENVILAAVGAVAGFVAGCAIAPSMQLRMAQVLGRGGLSFPASSALITLAVVEVLVAGATVLPAWRAGRISTSRAITQGAAPARVGRSRLASIATRAHLRAPLVTGAKDAGARPLRAVLTVVTLVMTVVAVVITLGFQRTVNGLAGNPAVLGDPQHLVVSPQAGVSHAELEAALADPRIASWFTATQRRGSVGGSATFQVRALGGDVARSGYVVRDGHMLQGAGDTLVGYGLMQRFGLHVGDPVTITVSGVALPFEVVGWYSETEDSGAIALITMDGLRRAEPAATEGDYFVRLHHPADQVAVRAALQARFGEGVRVNLVSQNLGDLDAFRAAFLAVTLLVLLVGLVNLIATTMLGIRERLRDLAVLKAVGFTPRQVAESVATTTGVLGLVATAFGIPLGLAANWALMRTVGTSTGVGPGIGQAPTVIALVLLVPAALALTAGVGALAARGAARAQVAEVLRAE